MLSCLFHALNEIELKTPSDDTIPDVRILKTYSWNRVPFTSANKHRS